jgi:glycosyltransferase involved in cell wall biosynthesis
MYPANTVTSGIYGHERLPGLLAKLKPDVVCLLNDPWVISTYQKVLEKQTVVAYMPVDGENQWAARKLNWLAHAIAYTRFGARELRKGGYTGPLSVAPHGIDLTAFKPESRADARLALKFAPDDQAAFIVGNVNRNQPRKRLDLTLLAFKYLIDHIARDANVRLLLHCALVDAGWELLDLCRYLGLERHLIFTGIKDIKDYDKMSSLERLRHIYCAMDVHVSTSIGEGWGLTAMESMACGVLNVLPEHSAYSEWARDGALLYSAPTTVFMTEGINTAGHIPDVSSLGQSLLTEYASPVGRERLAARGLALVRQPEFKWSNVAKTFDRVFHEVTHG